VCCLAGVPALWLVWVLSGYSGALQSTETVNRLILGAVLREYDQSFAMEIQVHQREAGAQSVVVFRQSPVAHLVEAEDAFEDAEQMFELSPNARLTAVLKTWNLCRGPLGQAARDAVHLE
jgi:hypothetical protein